MKMERFRATTDRTMHGVQPKPEPLPGADRIKTLLDNGEKEKARRYGNAFNIAWFRQAKAGELMNLSDMMAVNEQLMIDHHGTK